MEKSAQLYVVATPIGNLDDISARAIDVLTKVDIICAEDTRHTGKLLSHLDIKNNLQAFHDHNEKQRSQQLIGWLQEGKSVALVSDAGTPLISDPGYHIVTQVQKAGIKVVPVPGPCALITALCAAGLPTDRFYFEGFLPSKSNARQQVIESFKSSTFTWIFYESPHRIVDCLKDLAKVLGEDRPVAIGRELTKTFETIVLKPIGELVEFVESDRNQQKGEFVVMVKGDKEQAESTTKAEVLLKELIDANIPLKQAAEIAANHYGERKNHLKKLALSWQDSK